MDAKNKTLVNDADIHFEKIFEGAQRKIMTYCDELMLTKMTFEKGAIGAIHNHQHIQMGYVAKGAFEVSIGNETKILKQGDVFYAPSMVFHGVVCLEEGELIDVFNPKREDFLG